MTLIIEFLVLYSVLRPLLQPPCGFTPVNQRAGLTLQCEVRLMLSGSIDHCVRTSTVLRTEYTCREKKMHYGYVRVCMCCAAPPGPEGPLGRHLLEYMVRGDDQSSRSRQRYIIIIAQKGSSRRSLTLMTAWSWWAAWLSRNKWLRVLMLAWRWALAASRQGRR